MSTTENSTSGAQPQTIWIPCPICWGQRFILEDHNGEGLVSRSCRSCMGIGEQIAA